LISLSVEAEKLGPCVPTAVVLPLASALWIPPPVDDPTSPHDLRHRRISLLHRQGRSWAEIARFVGQRKLSLTADTYTHVLSDGRELDYEEVLRRR
jgi:integrase